MPNEQKEMTEKVDSLYSCKRRCFIHCVPYIIWGQSELQIKHNQNEYIVEIFRDGVSAQSFLTIRKKGNDSKRKLFLEDITTQSRLRACCKTRIISRNAACSQILVGDITRIGVEQIVSPEYIDHRLHEIYGLSTYKTAMSTYIVTCHSTGAVAIWDATTLELLNVNCDHKEGPAYLSMNVIHKNVQYLLTWGQDNVRVFMMESLPILEFVRCIEIPQNPKTWTLKPCCRFNRALLFATNQFEYNVIDFESGKVIKTRTRIDAPINDSNNTWVQAEAENTFYEIKQNQVYRFTLDINNPELFSNEKRVPTPVQINSTSKFDFAGCIELQ
jgi:hypothetical protein